MSAAGPAAAPPEAGAELRRLLRRVCETPAPTFEEEARARLVSELLRDVGLEPRRDAAGNVLVEPSGGRGARVALVAHLDTVFGAEVDVTVREAEDGRWCAPGIGDNAASVAVLLHLASEIARGRLADRPRLLLAFTVGEEGLGDLRGARRLVDDEGDALDALIAIDGHLGSVVDAAVGSWRVRVQLRAAGGHAWGDYPSPSAVHALGDVVHALTRIPVPEAPRSSLNVGRVHGGSAINAIAAEAWATVDVRSVDRDTLSRLAGEVEKRLRSVARRHRVEVRIEPVGERPAGRSDDGRLARVAEAALRAHGVDPRRGASSTDANVAMADGLPALCLGVYRGGSAHRLEEWLDPDSLATGAAVMRSLLAGWADAPPTRGG